MKIILKYIAKKLLIFVVFLMLPNFVLAGTKVLDYGFEDWTGWNGNYSPAPGYPFSTSQSAFWPTHMENVYVGGTVGGISPHSGNYFYIQGFFEGAVDSLLGKQPTSVSAHSQMGLNYAYPLVNPPTITKNTIIFSDSLTDPVAVLRFWFLAGPGWNDDIKGYRGWNSNVSGGYDYEAGRVVAYNNGTWPRRHYFEANTSINNDDLNDFYASGGGSNYIDDADANFAVNAYAGMELWLSEGTGSLQNRTIVSNTATQITVDEAWETIPDATTRYGIGFAPPTEDTVRWTDVTNIATTKNATASLDAGGGMKWVRIDSGPGEGHGESIIRAKMDAGDPYPDWDSSATGSTPTYVSMENSSIDWHDGNWHSFVVKTERNYDIIRQDSVPTAAKIGEAWVDTDNGNAVYRAASAGADEIASGEWESGSITNNITNTVYIDDWNMTGTVGWNASATHTQVGWMNHIELYYLFDNWCASYPDEQLDIAIDDIEVWNGDPNETSDTTAPSTPSGLAVS